MTSPEPLHVSLTRVLDRAELVLAVLFGSAASGKLQADSDIDLAILPVADLGLREELDLQVELERATGRRVDLVRLDQAAPQVRFEVARTGVVLRERSERAWVLFKARAMVDWWDWAPTARRLHRAWRDWIRSGEGQGRASG